MIYLVNRETKEHKIDRCPEAMAAEGWYRIHADPEGWIKHNGDECPLPDDCRVSVLFSDGTINATEEASYWGWRDSAPTHYRPILEDKPQPESDEQILKRRESEGVERLLKKYPDIIDRLAAAHEAASEIPDLVAELRAKLEPLGLGVMYLSQFDAAEPSTDERPRQTRRQQLIRAGIPAHEFDGIKKHKLNEPAGGSPAESLAEAFVWEDTPQGQEHWVKWESLLN